MSSRVRSTTSHASRPRIARSTGRTSMTSGARVFLARTRLAFSIRAPVLCGAIVAQPRSTVVSPAFGPLFTQNRGIPVVSSRSSGIVPCASVDATCSGSGNPLCHRRPVVHPPRSSLRRWRTCHLYVPSLLPCNTTQYVWRRKRQARPMSPCHGVRGDGDRRPD